MVMNGRQAYMARLRANYRLQSSKGVGWRAATVYLTRNIQMKRWGGEVGMREPAVLDDLLPVFQAMIGGPINREESEGPPLCDADIERGICGVLSNEAGVRVACDDGWVKVEGDVERWDEVERVTFGVPGVKGLTRHRDTGNRDFE